jgi:mono/diheme cytochrome c family protein
MEPVKYAAGSCMVSVNDHVSRKGQDLRAVLLTLVVVIVVLIGGGFAFVYSGVYDVAAVHPDNPLVARVIHLTSDRSVAARLDAIAVPAGFDAPEKVAAGAKLFGATCVVCHGGPGLQQTDISKGLNPTPPNLLRAGRHSEPNEAFWFISNGVKMTGMPGFSKSLSDDEIWSLVAFLGSASGISAADFATKTGISSTPDRGPRRWRGHNNSSSSGNGCSGTVAAWARQI